MKNYNEKNNSLDKSETIKILKSFHNLSEYIVDLLSKDIKEIDDLKTEITKLEEDIFNENFDSSDTRYKNSNAIDDQENFNFKRITELILNVKEGINALISELEVTKDTNKLLEITNNSIKKLALEAVPKN